jgi:site-specific DNA recombinase
MGRLTLNVLLSFAQFEREVTSERIRDEIAASKRKGLWVGGVVPLGYETRDRKVTVNEAEAERVRAIFKSYLKLGSPSLLMADLRERGVVTKLRTLKGGRINGGIPFTRGPLAHVLRNRFYGVAFKGEVLKGEQPPIIGRDLFDAVQAKLTEQATNHEAKRVSSDALLTGLMYDDLGNRMSPAHARKRGIKYRYYISGMLLQGAAERAGSVRRVPAIEIEQLIVSSVRKHLELAASLDDRVIVKDHVSRVEVESNGLAIKLNGLSAAGGRSDDSILYMTWQKLPSKRRREILLPESTSAAQVRPIRAETRATLVAAIARDGWLNELVTDPAATAETIARREGCSARKVNMTTSLAFLAPDLVKASIEGRLPRGIGVARLSDLPSNGLVSTGCSAFQNTPTTASDSVKLVN